MHKQSQTHLTFPLLALALVSACGTARADTLLVSNIFGSAGVSAFNGSTGASVGTFAPALPPYHQTGSLAVDGSNNVYVANYAGYPDSTITEYNSSGSALRTVATAQGVITGMALGGNGTLYVLDQTPDYLDHIDEFNAATGASLGSLVTPGTYFGLAVANNGDIVTNTYGSTLLFDPTGHQVAQFSGNYFSSHLTIDPAGDIFTSSFSVGQNQIDECAGCAYGSGSNHVLVTNSSGFGGMAIGPDGMLYSSVTVDGSTNGIEQINPLTGQDLGLFASGSNSTLEPYELAFIGTNFTSAAPEPSTLWLMASASVVAMVSGRRHRRKLRS